MGNMQSGLLNLLFGKKELRYIMVGLEGAGKTTILHRMTEGEVETIIFPTTVSFTVETVEYENIIYNVWGVGGEYKIQPLWRHYYQNVQCFIFVLDSSDRDRITEASQELNRILDEDEMRDVILLVFANKQDAPNAMKEDELTGRLGLQHVNNRVWHIQPCCAVTGDGIHKGLHWVSMELKKSRKQK